MQATTIPGPEVSKMVKKALVLKWPGVKFSVTYKSYSGGSSISVSYDDGPPWREVNAICKQFEGATFDGMQDLKSYRAPITMVYKGVSQAVEFGIDFVMAQRTLTDQARISVRQRFEDDNATTYNQWDNNHNSLFHQIAESVTFTN